MATTSQANKKKKSFWASAAEFAGNLGNALTGAYASPAAPTKPAGTQPIQPAPVTTSRSASAEGYAATPKPPSSSRGSSSPAAARPVVPPPTTTPSGLGPTAAAYLPPDQMFRQAQSLLTPPGPVTPYKPSTISPSPEYMRIIETANQAAMRQIEDQYSRAFEQIAKREAAGQQALGALGPQFAADQQASLASLQSAVDNSTQQVAGAVPIPQTSLGLTGAEGALPFQAAIQNVGQAYQTSIPIMQAGLSQQTSREQSAYDAARAAAMSDLSGDYMNRQADAYQRAWELSAQQQLAAEQANWQAQVERENAIYGQQADLAGGIYGQYAQGQYSAANQNPLDQRGKQQELAAGALESYAGTGRRMAEDPKQAERNERMRTSPKYQAIASYYTEALNAGYTSDEAIQLAARQYGGTSPDVVAIFAYDQQVALGGE